MRRRIARVLALSVLVVLVGPAVPASADVGIEADFCVSESYFFLRHIAQ